MSTPIYDEVVADLGWTPDLPEQTTSGLEDLLAEEDNAEENDA